MVRLLGISAFYHDSAAALVQDGKILAAAQEERFTRQKHDRSFPDHAIRYCLDVVDSDLDGVDHVVFFEKPFLKFERLTETYLALAPRGFRSFRLAMPVWIKEKLYQRQNLETALRAHSASGLVGDKLLFSAHHQSHAASTFYPSLFDEAVVLTMDGVGEWATTSVALGCGNEITTLREIRWPHSLGLLFSAFTYYCGFKVNSGEYKLMGLAPYGAPTHVRTILDKLIDLKEDGSFWLDQRYFEYATGLTMTSRKFDDLFGGPPREPGGPLTQLHMDLAASVQTVTEEIILRMTRNLSREFGCKNLCLAGGVALNCVANGKVLRDGRFDNLFIQPAAGDAGGAVGAALAAYHQHLGYPRVRHVGRDGMAGTYLGPGFSQREIEARLSDLGAVFSKAGTEAELCQVTCDALEAGGAVGWFQGRMEFGPRALGARSILGDPRRPDMQQRLNLKIKYRESFRPFAPSVLASDVGDYFELDCDSPYMLLVANVKEEHRLQLSSEEEALTGLERLHVARSDIPAVTHVDYSARVQTVHDDTNPRYYALLETFKRRTGCPVLVNTSFNVRGEPIVCTPEDAFRCFMATELDVLVIGDCVLEKSAQAVACSRRDPLPV
ncbi:MAG: carbamoyltransferase [Pseudomonadota bacterium]